jgi:hypothetical protein
MTKPVIVLGLREIGTHLLLHGELPEGMVGARVAKIPAIALAGDRCGTLVLDMPQEPLPCGRPLFAAEFADSSGTLKS